MFVLQGPASQLAQAHLKHQLLMGGGLDWLQVNQQHMNMLQKDQRDAKPDRDVKPELDVKPKTSPHEAQQGKSGGYPPDIKPGAVPSPYSLYSHLQQQPPPSKAASSSVTVKQDQPNFNLYGYQPHPLFIYPDKGQGQTGDKVPPHSTAVKEEKPEVKEEGKIPPYSVESKKGILPPPLIRDPTTAQPSSVIVENNKVKDSPPQIHPHGSITSGLPRHQGIPHPHPHPPPHPHPHPSHSNPIPLSTVPSSTMDAASILAAMPTTGARVGQPLLAGGGNPGRSLPSPQQQPMDLQTKTPAASKSSDVQSRVQELPAHLRPIAQPPVSLPTGVTCAYSAMATALPTNPRYTQASGISTGRPHPQEGGQHSMHIPGAPPQQPLPSHDPRSTAAAAKRPRPHKPDGSSRQKKAKLEEGPTPVTSVTVSSQSAPGDNPRPVVVMTPSNPAALTRTGPQHPNATYIDSFRNFVEQAVHVAFYQDPELNSSGQKPSPPPLPPQLPRQPVKDTAPPGKPENTQNTPVATESQKANVTVKSDVKTEPAQVSPQVPRSETTTSPVTMATNTSSLPQLQRPGPASTPGGASVSSTSSIMETINRVANGCLDTDSDTLSAPSPQPGGNGDSSQAAVKATGSHPSKNLKKAWITRFSEEDTNSSTKDTFNKKMNINEGKSAVPEGGDNSESSNSVTVTTTSKQTTNPTTNTSEVSPRESTPTPTPSTTQTTPAKPDEVKSPITFLKDMASRQDDEMTSSASEAESQIETGGKRRGGKKRPGNGNAGKGSKKVKVAAAGQSEAADVTNGPGTPNSTSSNKKRSRKGHKNKVSRGGNVMPCHCCRELRENPRIKVPIIAFWLQKVASVSV